MTTPTPTPPDGYEVRYHTSERSGRRYTLIVVDHIVISCNCTGFRYHSRCVHSRAEQAAEARSLGVDVDALIAKHQREMR